MVRLVHRALPGYRATPLVELPGLAKRLGIKRLMVKDESQRFDLKAFKSLGASYAVFRLINRWREQNGDRPVTPEELFSGTVIPKGQHTLCTATDGNHGRGVAWVARLLGQRAVIYMPKGTVSARMANIRNEGAEVIVVDGTYDLAVETARSEAAEHGWTIISDTSWDGYTEIPMWISEGYLTLFAEIEEQSNDLPNFVFIPGGVGALAATAAWWYSQSSERHATRLVSVEPTSADCLYRSIQNENGEPVTTDASLDSIMAGLNCGTPSPVAWPFIRDRFDEFVTIDDARAIEAMRTYYHPIETDQPIVSGESGAATLGALLALHDMNWPDLRGATVLLFSTEGDTDPEHFKQVVAKKPE